MKVKYLGDSDPLELLQDKIYDVIEVDAESGWYRIIDETGEDYLFPPEDFEVIASTTSKSSSDLKQHLE